MLCSLCGQVPVEPVVSLKSGHVFEKRLVLKYLEQNQRCCPITNEELDAERDLLALQTATSKLTGAKPNAAILSPEAFNVPQLLSTFQNEWDAVMLETFTLKQHLEQTRQELSHALYQHDAACRVIARLNADNATLRDQVARLATNESRAHNEVDMDGPSATSTSGGSVLAADILTIIETTQKQLATWRKDFRKTDGPQRAARLTELNSWQCVSSHTLHDADRSGVTCVAIDQKRPTLVATGGVDKHVQVFDTQSQQLVAKLTGHGKKVSHVEFHPTADLVVTASLDKTVKLWTAQDKGYSVGYTLDGFDDAVTSVSIHPTGNYVLSGSLDATWAIHDVRRGQLLSRYTLSGELAMPEGGGRSKSKHLTDETRTARFHPDGGIFGTAAKSKVVQMWAVNSLSNVVTFEGHEAPVTTLCFSENGYHLASGSEDGVVKLWDLRKATSFFELDLKKESAKLELGSIHSISFDASGSHLAVASAQTVQVLKEVSKNSWEVVKSFSDHKAAVTGVQFAPDSSFLASTSMDRSLKIYR
uniref:Pre-mRNA-processing factor 19 n=1 Tax=Peronospora matthiolae TaxID=2874970 RepID=A0AAV1T825_9STRA